jgi:hypothetical protein
MLTCSAIPDEINQARDNLIQHLLETLRIVVMDAVLLTHRVDPRFDLEMQRARESASNSGLWRFDERWLAR